MATAPTHKPPTPAQRTKELETALQVERDRVLACQTLLEVAQIEHRLSIRKRLPRTVRVDRDL